MQEYKSRWKGKTARSVSIATRKIAKARHAKLTPRQRQLIARKMVAARGHWEVNEEGKKVYVRHTKQQ